MGLDVTKRKKSVVGQASWWGISGSGLSKPLGGLLGECELARRLITVTPCGFSHTLQVIDAVLRGIAQVVFANNPISGLLIVIGLFVADPAVGRAALICSFAAFMLATYCGLGETQIQVG